MKIFLIVFSVFFLQASSLCEKRSKYWLEGYRMALYDLGTEVGITCGDRLKSNECIIAQSIYQGVFDMWQLEKGRSPDVGFGECDESSLKEELKGVGND